MNSQMPPDPEPTYDTWVPEAALNAMREERDKARQETTYWADQYELISRELAALREYVARFPERDASLRRVVRL